MATRYECHGALDDQFIFIDDAVSGADVRRLRQRQRMIDLTTNACPFDVVIMQSQDRFSRRDGDEAFGELKAIARTGVELWFYADRKRFEHGTFESNTLGFLNGEFAAEFRRAIARKTHEAMLRRAQQGHVTGGKVFGYDKTSGATATWSASSTPSRLPSSATSTSGTPMAQGSSKSRTH